MSYKQRIESLHTMNDCMMNANHEDAYYNWILIFPDEATEEDIADIASDDELYNDCCKAFDRIMYHYAKYGFVFNMD